MPPVFQSIANLNGVINFTWSAVASQTYQVQSGTDFSNWANLGSRIVATNGTANASDVVGSNQALFYRVVLLP
ncbi:MAG TPA: hypothetical protein VN578_01145 [Candidatus Binatia bacterium]|nr:hypothetical protein [Candidatus Binatia bacterium]